MAKRNDVRGYSQIGTTQAAGKVAELYVFNELLKRGAAVYLPLVDEGVDAVVRTPTGHTIDLQIKSSGGAGGKYPGWFQISRVEPRPDFFIISVESQEGEPGNVWVFPSTIFDKYASLPPKGSPRDLDLDSGIRKYGMPLRDLLCGFRNRWELLLNFEKFAPLMETTQDLEDLLTVIEAQEAPVDEITTLEDYDRRGSSKLPD